MGVSWGVVGVSGSVVRRPGDVARGLEQAGAAGTRSVACDVVVDVALSGGLTGILQAVDGRDGWSGGLGGFVGRSGGAGGSSGAVWVGSAVVDDDDDVAVVVGFLWGSRVGCGVAGTPVDVQAVVSRLLRGLPGCCSTFVADGTTIVDSDVAVDAGILGVSTVAWVAVGTLGGG